jgi:hypothetical protein
VQHARAHTVACTSPTVATARIHETPPPTATPPQTTKGIVYLDDLTFDRIVTGRDHVLVRFDKEYR